MNPSVTFNINQDSFKLAMEKVKDIKYDFLAEASRKYMIGK
jgi:hypothetical protein